MFIIQIKRIWLVKALATVFMSVFVCSIGFNLYHHQQNIKVKDEYESMSCMVKQLGKGNLFTFLSATDRMEQRYKTIEIFDIEKEAVIKRIVSNATIQKQVENFLKGITGMYVKVNAFPDKGHIVRVPFEPSLKIQNQWLKQDGINSIQEVFILFPKEGNPYLLVLDEKKRPFFYNFKGDTTVLLKNLNFELQN